jgi:hypothetical protein
MTYLFQPTLYVFQGDDGEWVAQFEWGDSYTEAYHDEDVNKQPEAGEVEQVCAMVDDWIAYESLKNPFRIPTRPEEH